MLVRIACIVWMAMELEIDRLGSCWEMGEYGCWLYDHDVWPLLPLVLDSTIISRYLFRGLTRVDLLNSMSCKVALYLSVDAIV